MKKLLLVATFMFGQAVLAAPQECVDRITYNNNVDSASITFLADDYVHENDHVGDAYNLARLFVSRKGCNVKDLRFTAGPDSNNSGLAVCNKIARGKPHSEVCYVESNIGYFFVTRDMVSGATVIFNRWD